MKEMQVLPHVERLGQYALVTLAGRSELPVIDVFRDFARLHFDE